MLRLLGSSKKLCDGVTRRDFLEIGGLSALGASLSDLFRWQRAQAATPSARSFGKGGEHIGQVFHFTVADVPVQDHAGVATNSCDMATTCGGHGSMP